MDLLQESRIENQEPRWLVSFARYECKCVCVCVCASVYVCMSRECGSMWSVEYGQLGFNDISDICNSNA